MLSLPLILFFILILLTLNIINLRVNLEVLQRFGLIFLKHLLKVIIILPGQDILVFLYEILLLNLDVLGLLLYFALLEAGFYLFAFLEEVFFVLFASEFLLLFLETDFLWG